MTSKKLPLVFQYMQAAPVNDPLIRVVGRNVLVVEQHNELFFNDAQTCIFELFYLQLYKILPLLHNFSKSMFKMCCFMSEKIKTVVVLLFVKFHFFHKIKPQCSQDKGT